LCLSLVQRQPIVARAIARCGPGMTAQGHGRSLALQQSNARRRVAGTPNATDFSSWLHALTLAPIKPTTYSSAAAGTRND
jgi:hypothetical protein